MDITREHVERYLSEVRELVMLNRYTLSINSNRSDNMDLFQKYIIDRNGAKNIILSLTADDFSTVLNNEHDGYEYERLYVFGKDVRLVERFGTEEKNVSLYIKFNKIEKSYVIVISFHEQRYPLPLYFR